MPAWQSPCPLRQPAALPSLVLAMSLRVDLLCVRKALLAILLFLTSDAQLSVLLT